MTQNTYKKNEAETQFLNLVNMVGLWQRGRVWQNGKERNAELFFHLE